MKKQILFFLFAFVLSISANAQWSTNSAVNNVISDTTGNQAGRTIVSDGSGGAIIAWIDRRSGAYDVYAQRINALGVVQWTLNGLAICTAANDQAALNIVSDGSGGAIITWEDYRTDPLTSDIYAQRINGSGVVQWTTNGVAICAAANSQYSPTLVSDGSGGAIITWRDYRSGVDFNIYAQRVSASGIQQWIGNGVVVSNASNDQVFPIIVSDGSGGAIITWEDDRSGTMDVYAQRINASGIVQWTTDGVAISTATSDQNYPTLVSDGLGGAIITWYDNRGVDFDIYAQLINTSGVVQWATDGVTISTATANQLYPTIISDGSNGAIISWQDERSGTPDIYAQSINAAGVTQWIANGVAVCTATSDQDNPTLVSDGLGGAIITWYDQRNGVDYDIYAQRINASGVAQWIVDGVVISSATSNQYSPILVSDGSGGAIITWNDRRNGITFDIYAQNVSAGGAIGSTNGMLNQHGTPNLISLYPNPASNGLFSVSIQNIEASNLLLEIIDMKGSVVHSRYIGSVGEKIIVPFSLTGFKAGTYIMRVTANGKSTQLNFIDSE